MSFQPADILNYIKWLNCLANIAPPPSSLSGMTTKSMLSFSDNFLEEQYFAKIVFFNRLITPY